MKDYEVTMQLSDILSSKPHQSANNKTLLGSCYYYLNNLQKSFDNNNSVYSMNVSALRNHKKSSQTEEDNFSRKVKLPTISYDQRKNHNQNQNKCKFKGLDNSQNSLVKSILQTSLSPNASIDKSILSFLDPNIGKTSPQSSEHKKAKFSITKKLKNGHIYKVSKGLSRSQIFFEDKDISIDKNIINSKGILESGYLYKNKNVAKLAEDIHPTIYKKNIQIQKCKKGELFLTAPSQPKQFEKSIEEFMKHELFQSEFSEEQQKDKVNQMTNENGQISHSVCNNKQQEKKVIYGEHLLIQNYQLVKNEKYFSFKMKYIEDWTDFLVVVKQLCNYLRKYKIKNLQVKGNQLIRLWTGRKITQDQIQKIVKINTQKIINTHKMLYNAFKVWKDLKTIRDMHLHQLRQKQLAKWVLTRFKTKIAIKKSQAQKLKLAQALNKKLMQNPEWDMQIHIPSFSQSSFLRNTTQYMQIFENCFFGIWNSQPKYYILVIPTVNQVLLELLQNKFKMHRNITIINPQVHSLFPKQLHLSGNLLFSYDALNRIKKLVKGRKPAIVPGRCSNLYYQKMISAQLQIPLLSNINIPRNISFYKQLFIECNIETPVYICIPPESTLDNLIQSFAKLLIEHQNVKKWIFKLNGEFHGRGIGTFQMQYSKKITELIAGKNANNIGSWQYSKFIEYLRQYVILKLEVNFTNCLFMLNEYLYQFRMRGGIIQAEIPNPQVYQISYEIKNKENIKFLSCFHILSEKYASKVCTLQYQQQLLEDRLSEKSSQIPQKLREIQHQIKKVLIKGNYFGYVSVIVALNETNQKNNNQCSLLQIKPWITVEASIKGLINCIEKQKCFPNHSYQALLSGLSSERILRTVQKSSYLIVPYIVFTDVALQSKINLIQEIMTEVFAGKKNKNISQDTKKMFFSLGMTLTLVISGKDMKKIKKEAIQTIRHLAEKIEVLKAYRGKQQKRDLFQFGDIIRAITQLKI